MNSHFSSYVLLLVIAVQFLECDGYLRVCYYTNWSKGRPNGGGYDITKEYTVDENGLCTHMIYSFAKVSKNAENNKFWIDPYNADDTTTGYSKVSKSIC